MLDIRHRKTLAGWRAPTLNSIYKEALHALRAKTAVVDNPQPDLFLFPSQKKEKIDTTQPAKGWRQNHQQYGQLLIEAKDKTNVASRELSDGPLKAEMQAVMDTYADAAEAWAEKIRSRELNLESEPGTTLFLSIPSWANVTNTSGVNL